MKKHKRTINDTAEVDKMMQDHLDNTPPEALSRKLDQQIDAFGNYLATRPPKHGWRRLWRPELRWAYSLALVLILLGLGFYSLGANPPPTWAEVAERFSTVSYMHATIYAKPGPLETASALELWLREDGKIRFRSGNTMLFGDDFNVHTTIPFQGATSEVKDPLYTQPLIQEVIEELGHAGQFSLEALVQALPMEGALSAPLPNENASISKDLVVFDFDQEGQEDGLRIWTLRDSRLPVRLVYWNPSNGETIDVVLSYAGPQPTEFFDPEAFQRYLEQDPENPIHWAYGLLHDVDGLPMHAIEK